MLFVFAVIVAALVLFATEALPVDVTAIADGRAMLAEPVTVLATDLGMLAAPVYVLHQACTGFAAGSWAFRLRHTATLTVLAMFILARASSGPASSSFSARKSPR